MHHLPWVCQAAWPLHHLLRNARKKALQRKKVPAGAEEIVAAAPGSCLIDGEVVACDEMGSPYSTGSAKTKSYAMLVALDLLELDGADDDALGGGP